MDVDVLGGRIEVDVAYVAEPVAEVRRQVAEYERGERRSFDLTVAFPETFTGAVMREIEAVPYGETTTYGAIADALDTAPVAVGRACGANPVPLVIPCHRVVASDGALRGYSAPGGLPLKRRLLAHEQGMAAGTR